MDGTYQLPFGRNRMLFATVNPLMNDIIGDWDLSGVGSFHTGDAMGDFVHWLLARQLFPRCSRHLHWDESGAIKNQVTKVITVQDFKKC